MCAVLNRKFHTSENSHPYDPSSPSCLFQCVTVANWRTSGFPGAVYYLKSYLAGRWDAPPPPHTQISDLNEQVYTNRFHEDQVIMSCVFFTKACPYYAAITIRNTVGRWDFGILSADKQHFVGRLERLH